MISGCSNSPERARSYVMDKYPNSTIINTPNSRYSFLVRLQNGELRLVKCFDNTDQITEDYIIMPALK